MALFVLIVGAGSLGLGVGNTAQIKALKGTVADLNNHVLENRHTINLLREGVEKLSQESDVIIDYVHGETHRLYQVIEGVRCDSYNRDMEMFARIAMLAQETYLHAHVTAAMNAAFTGTLTPEVLGMKRLLKILQTTPGLRESFVTQEPYIVYNQAKVYSVKIDLES